MEKLKILIGILVIAGGIYYAWNMIPPYLHNYEFQDDLDDIARLATYATRTDDELKQAVIKKASTHDIVLKDDQISLTRLSNGVAITVHYRVHVDMMIHPTDLDFTANTKNTNIIAGS